MAQLYPAKTQSEAQDVTCPPIVRRDPPITALKSARTKNEHAMKPQDVFFWSSRAHLITLSSERWGGYEAQAFELLLKGLRLL